MLSRARVVCALWLGMMAACDGPDVATWRIRFDSGAAPGATALVHGEIRTGGCAGPARYAADIRRGDPMGMSPGALPPGQYGFAAEARDADCNLIAEGCTEITIPTDGDISVVLTTTSARAACAGRACIAGTCVTDDMGVDAGPTDAAPADAGRDAGPTDAGSDAGPTDAGRDAGPTDAGSDAGPADAGPTDAGRDAGPTDAGPTDAGSDAGPTDAGSDGGPPDLGPPDLGPPDLGPPPGDVHVVITADNAYSFAYGSATTLTTFVRGARASLAGEIFNCPVGVGPEAYTVPGASAPPGAYLYIITWDDLRVTQGVLGEFERDGSFVYTGDDRFEVCATGVDYARAAPGIDPIAGPTQAVVEAEIARCNAGSGSPGTTSRGWVDLAGAVSAGALGALAVGEANDPVPDGIFPPACAGDATTLGIDTVARWMWYAPPGLTTSPFESTGTNTFRAFLIFRLPADQFIRP